MNKEDFEELPTSNFPSIGFQLENRIKELK